MKDDGYCDGKCRAQLCENDDCDWCARWHFDKDLILCPGCTQERGDPNIIDSYDKITIKRVEL